MNSIFGFRLILAAALFAFVAGCSPAEEPGPVDTRDTMPEAGTPVALWEATAGVDTPESVYLDEGSGYLFVSMIAGEPDAKDGNGRIAQLDRDGWKNNDLWNLLPSSANINNIKRDKIPSPETINKRKDSIIRYWELLNEKLPERFQREFQISLIGATNKANWQHAGIENLQRHCNYLIGVRGYEMWNP
jgi:hypothetical protein